MCGQTRKVGQTFYGAGPNRALSTMPWMMAF
jgi:hypothetical protein